MNPDRSQSADPGPLAPCSQGADALPRGSRAPFNRRDPVHLAAAPGVRPIVPDDRQRPGLLALSHSKER